MKKQNTKKRKLVNSLLVGIPPLMTVGCSNPSLGLTSNTDQISIQTIFADLPPLSNLETKPDSKQILSYLNQYVQNTTYSNVVNDLTVDSIDDSKAVVVANPHSRQYTGTINVNYILKVLQPLSSVIGNTPLWDGTSTAPTTIPDKVTILKRIQELNPNVSANQITCDTNEVAYDNSTESYSVIISANPYSDYTGTQTVTFKLYQRTVILLGLEFKFAHDDPEETDPIISISANSGNQIVLRRGGEYNIVDDGNGVTNRAIVLPDGTSESILTTKINLVGGNIAIKPVDATGIVSNYIPAIRLGKYNDATFQINSISTDIVGGRYAAGICVPSTSSLTLTGSTTLTVLPGTNDGTGNIGFGTSIGGISRNVSGSNSELDCGWVRIKGNVNLSSIIPIYAANSASDREYSVWDTATPAIIGGGANRNEKGTGGNCAGVEIDTTGIVNIGYSIAEGSTNNYTIYSFPMGALIGGGGAGDYTKVTSSSTSGNLGSFIMNKGTLNINAGRVGSRMYPTAIGGGAYGTHGRSLSSTTHTNGSLTKFEMYGGTINIDYDSRWIVDNPNGGFLNIQFIVIGSPSFIDNHTEDTSFITTNLTTTQIGTFTMNNVSKININFHYSETGRDNGTPIIGKGGLYYGLDTKQKEYYPAFTYTPHEDYNEYVKNGWITINYGVS